jgi:hypothetical protein
LHIARPATEEDGNLFNAKNPRSLQFTAVDRLYEIRMHERCRAPRGCLLGIPVACSNFCVFMHG